MIEQPLMHARSFEDKLNIYNNLVRALAGKTCHISLQQPILFISCLILVSHYSITASSKLEEGIEKCLSILAQLGEVYPTTITPDVFMSEDALVKQLLHGKSRQELLSLPIMSDPRKLVSTFSAELCYFRCAAIAHAAPLFYTL